MASHSLSPFNQGRLARSVLFLLIVLDYLMQYYGQEKIFFPKSYKINIFHLKFRYTVICQQIPTSEPERDLQALECVCRSPGNWR